VRAALPRLRRALSTSVHHPPNRRCEQPMTELGRACFDALHCVPLVDRCGSALDDHSGIEPGVDPMDSRANFTRPEPELPEPGRRTAELGNLSEMDVERTSRGNL